MKGNKFYVSLFFLFSIIAITLLYFNEQISTDPASEVDDPIEENTDKNSSDSNNDNSKGNSNENSGKDSEKEFDDKTNSDEIYWGLDSAGAVDSKLYTCAKENFGVPDVWGRYLGDIKDVSKGLDKEEVNFLHDRDVKILVIYNHFDGATGYDNGTTEAQEAIAYAKDLNIPEDVAIFGDIEPNLPVDSAFIDGWYETLNNSKYNAGIYGVFAEDSQLFEAYQGSSEDTLEETIVWTAVPQEGITSKDKAPTFNPQGPDDANVYGWQYGQDAKKCNVDTNLFNDDIVNYLWNN